MRAILRMSINGEGNSVLRNALRRILENHGFHLTNATATYENVNISIAQLGSLMQEFWQTAANPEETVGSNPGVHVDHVWFYTDEAKP